VCSSDLYQAAKYLKVSEKTLRRWEKNGRISPIRTRGGHRRYTVDQLRSAKRTKIYSSKNAVLELRSHKFLETKFSPLQTDIYKEKDEKVRDVIKAIYPKIPSPHKNLIKISTIAFCLLFLSIIYPKINLGQLKNQLLLNNLIKKENLGKSSNISSQVLAATSLNNVSFNVNVRSNFAEDATFNNAIYANGAVIDSTSAAFELLTSPASINLGSSANQITIGSQSGTTTIRNSISVEGTDNDISGTLNLSGNNLTSSGDLSINPAGGAVSIGTASPNSIDSTDGDLFVSSDLEVDQIEIGRASCRERV